jgi:hypothetical protein
VTEKEMRNKDYRVIISIVFICLLSAACPVENTNTGEIYEYGKFGDFEWYFDNEKMVISKYTGEGGDVTVPPEIDGKPVNAIGSHAFRDCKNLESVILPNSITAIGYSAFYGCTALNSINIPNSVTTIGDGAFGWCWELKSVNIPDGVPILPEIPLVTAG